MATGSMAFVESGLADLDKLLQSLEIENKYQQNEIQKEQQQTAAFEAAIAEKEESMKTLKDEITRLDEETKNVHQQFRCNKETYDSLKNHYFALVQNQESAQKDLHELQDKWQIKQAEHERLLQHYESVWGSYKAKYEERELAVELRQWQQQSDQTLERLGESQLRVKMLKTAIQEHQDKKKNALKPFKSLNSWVIQLAEVWAKTRALRKEKEAVQHSIDDVKRKLQDKRDKELQQQKEQEELERKKKLKEAEERQRQEEIERQKQQRLYQQQQIKAQQQQQQQLKQQELRQQQSRLLLPAAASPHQIPQSPLQQPVRRTHQLQSQYFRSPLIGTAATRPTPAAASPAQQQWRPPLLQMPIMASPRRTAVSAAAPANSNQSSNSLAQKFTISRPIESPKPIQHQQHPAPSPLLQSTVQQATDAPARQEPQAPPCQGAEGSRLSTASQRTIPRPDEPIMGGQGAAQTQETDRQVDGQVLVGETHQTDPDPATNELPKTLSFEATGLQEPGTPGSVISLPPRSPFDLEAHLQSLNEMAKSPGFTFSCRPMYGGQDEISDEAPDKIQRDGPQPAPSSSSETFETPFMNTFFTGMGGVSQPSSHPPIQLFGSSTKDKESPRPTGASIFGRPDSPMDVGQSKTQGGIMSLFGGGPGAEEDMRDDEAGSPAGGFSFNFSGGAASPNDSNSGQGGFSLF